MTDTTTTIGEDERALRERGAQEDAGGEPAEARGEEGPAGSASQEAEAAEPPAKGVSQGEMAPPPAESQTMLEKERTPEGEEAFHRQWWDHVRKEVEATPELKDERSEMAQALRAVLRETPLYSLAPDGFHHAAAVAKARVTAGTVPTLQAKLAALTKENERLVALTSLRGSGPTRGAGEQMKDFSERDLRRMAAELDSL